MKVCIGSRESKLAVIQSEMVQKHIIENNDDIEVDIVVCDVGLDGSGKMLIKLLCAPLAVEKEGAARLYVVDDLVALQDI